MKLSTLCTALAAALLWAGPALAHSSPDTDVKWGGGNWKLTASTAIADPADGSSWQTWSVPFTSATGHHIQFAN